MISIDSIRDGIKRMQEAGVTPRVLQMNQATRDALGAEVDALGLRVSVRRMAPNDIVYIVQKEEFFNVNGKVFCDPETAEDYVDEMFGCEVYGVDWIDITTMEDAAAGREVWVVDLAGITCGVGGTE